MKKLFVLSLVAVLSVGLLSVGAFAQVSEETDSDSTNVHWYFNGCQLSMTAHDPVSLGNGDPISTLDTVSNVDNTVTTNGNCPYALSVYTRGYEAPIGNDIYLDFALWVDSSTNSLANSGINQQSEATGFDSVNDGILLADPVSDSGDKHFDMGYLYAFDADDEVGSYRVDLEYIVSTT